MLVGHLLCGIIFGALLAFVGLVIGLSLLEAVAALLIGTHVGLGASLPIQRA